MKKILLTALAGFALLGSSAVIAKPDAALLNEATKKCSHSVQSKKLWLMNLE